MSEDTGHKVALVTGAALRVLLVGAGADNQLAQAAPGDLLSMELSKVGTQLQTLLGNYFDAELSNCELIKCYMIAELLKLVQKLQCSSKIL